MNSWANNMLVPTIYLAPCHCHVSPQSLTPHGPIPLISDICISRTRTRARGTYSTGWSNWILLRKLKHFICCLIVDIFLFLVWHPSNSIYNTSIAGVKSSWTSLSMRLGQERCFCALPPCVVFSQFHLLAFSSLLGSSWPGTFRLGSSSPQRSHTPNLREPQAGCSTHLPRQFKNSKHSKNRFLKYIKAN